MREGGARLCLFVRCERERAPKRAKDIACAREREKKRDREKRRERGTA